MSTKMTDTTPATSKPTGIKKLNLGGIAQKSEKSGKEYPVLPDPDGQIAQLRAKIASLQIQLQSVQGQLKDLGAKTVTYQCRDPNTASNSRGATANCGFYLCDPVQGLCKTQCSTSADCASGTTCDQKTDLCVLPKANSD